MANLKILLLVCLLAGLLSSVTPLQAQQIILANPQPSFDTPRKIILQLSSGNPQKINDILFNAVNLQEFYGIDNVRIRIVAFGRGMHALYANKSPVLERVQSLLKYNVEFIGCDNTMDATQHTPADLIPGVSHVRAGIAKIVESRLKGWVYIHP